jgi:hypothetical protein
MRRALNMGLVVLILIVFTSCNTDDSNQDKTLENAKKEKIAVIYGKWASQIGTLFEYSEEGKYGYYKDKDDTTDNYYKGTLEVLNGEDAMNELGITYEEYKNTLEKYVGKEDNIFALKMYTEELHSEGIDKNDILDKNNYYFFAFFVSKDDLNKAIAINFHDPQEIEVTKID